MHFYSIVCISDTDGVVGISAISHSEVPESVHSASTVIIYLMILKISYSIVSSLTLSIVKLRQMLASGTGYC